MVFFFLELSSRLITVFFFFFFLFLGTLTYRLDEHVLWCVVLIGEHNEKNESVIMGLKEGRVSFSIRYNVQIDEMKDYSFIL